MRSIGNNTSTLETISNSANSGPTSSYAGGSTPRICILLESYYPVIGGGETAAKMLVEELMARDVKVMVITRRLRDDLEKVEVDGGASIYRIPPVGSSHLKRWVMVLTSLPILIKMSRQYDLIFVPGFRALGISAVLVSKLLRKACVLKADNNGELSGKFFTGGINKMHLSRLSYFVALFLAIRNKILRSAGYFVSISSDISSEFTANGVPPNKVRLIPNAVDVDRFQPVAWDEKIELRRQLGLPLDKKVLVFTGRLVSWKGLPLLLKVWEQIHQKHPNAFLLLVGAGGTTDIYNCEEDLKEFVRSHHLQDSVGFTGDVYNVHEYLQASDIFVFPTENDAFGISLIEAMACGLPVIATSVGGIKDIITPGQDGLIIAPKDFRQLHGAVRLLLADTALAKSLGEAARQTATERYSQQTTVTKYLEVFRTVGASA